LRNNSKPRPKSGRYQSRGIKLLITLFSDHETDVT